MPGFYAPNSQHCISLTRFSVPLIPNTHVHGMSLQRAARSRIDFDIDLNTEPGLTAGMEDCRNGEDCRPLLHLSDPIPSEC
jgi:hypothetical protein